MAEMDRGGVEAVLPALAQDLGQFWWVLLVRGLLTITFGVMAFVWPGLTAATLVLLFGAFCLADGITGVWSSLQGRRDQDHWWALLLWSAVSIVIGLLTLFSPGVTALAIIFYIAVWAIATGVIEIVTAVRLRKEIEGEWTLAAAGAVSVIFGILLLGNPGAGVVGFLWLIGGFAILLGILLVMLSFKARGFSQQVRAQPA